MGRKRDIIFYASLAFLVAVAFIAFPSFYQRLFIEMMIYALLAMSLDLLVGYTGMVSFGHAAFFGISAYMAGILFTAGLPFFVSIVAAVAGTVILALLIGLFCIRVNGIQFAMLTLAFGQLMWTIITKWRDVTGGMDGMAITQSMRLQLGGWEINFTDTRTLLVLTAVILSLSYWTLRRLVDSPFGKTLLAVKENEERAQFLGYNHFLIKLRVFVISAGYASVAGICYLLLKTFLSPEYMSWHQSGNILMMTLLGGAGTLLGPLLGASLFVWVQDWISSYTENWMLFVGIAFMIIVLYFPKGVFGWMFYRKKRNLPSQTETGTKYSG